MYLKENKTEKKEKTKKRRTGEFGIWAIGDLQIYFCNSILTNSIYFIHSITTLLF